MATAAEPEGGPAAPPPDRPPARPPPALLSLVVPMYNEAAVLDRFFAAVEPVLAAVADDWEIIAVDDGSRDATLAGLLYRREREPRLKIVALARNFGKEQALTAGLDAAAGDVVVPIDVDLQDPPALIARFVEKWREGFDVVYGVRAERASDGPLKRWTAGAFYRLFNRLTATQIPADTGDFRLMDRSVVAAVRGLRERNRFMKGLFAWVGFRQTAVAYTRAPRAAGASSWTYWRLWNFALDGITSFSTVPLRLWSYIGAAVALSGFAYAAFLVVRTLAFGRDVPGFASIMVAVLFLGGVQLISLGVIGEYLGRLYLEAKGRPLYLVRQRWGVAQPPADPPDLPDPADPAAPPRDRAG